jgi:sulfur-carrier protein adenylyltransferase/sulfurtransferase
MGGRSAEAYHILKQAGFKKIKNLKGGILAWANEVDHTLPTY